jgi:hypothetical protein
VAGSAAEHVGTILVLKSQSFLIPISMISWIGNCCARDHAGRLDGVNVTHADSEFSIPFPLVPAADKGSEHLTLPAELRECCSVVSLLGVDYGRLKTSDGGELYLTKFGLPFWQNLLPGNWYARDWFETKRARPEGTSTVYRVPTQRVNGKTLNLVVKWSRVGEEVGHD